VNEQEGNGTAQPEDTGRPDGAGQVEAAERAGAGGDGDAITALATRIAELEDQRLRALADLDNERKRCAVQVRRAEAETRAAVARQWLPVVDNLDRALAHSAADPAAIIDGIEAVRAQALDVLTRLGFPLRDDRGTRFDPAAGEGTVVEVIRPGYGDGDHQLRPAQVVVARPD
jgi:molecular chaperone GrpE